MIFFKLYTSAFFFIKQVSQKLTKGVNFIKLCNKCTVKTWNTTSVVSQSRSLELNPSTSGQEIISDWTELPVVIFTNILRAAFSTIFFPQKITKPNCKWSNQNTFVWKSCSALKMFVKLIPVSSTFYVHIFCTNVVSAAFLYLHVCRKSCQNDIRPKNSDVKCL